jgi:uncharacterized lipoprotein
MKKLNKVGLLCVISLSAACAQIKPFDYQTQADALPVMQVPANLTLPALAENYKVPRSQETTQTTTATPPTPLIVAVAEAEQPAEHPVLIDAGSAQARIVIALPFDQSWRKVGLAIAQLHWLVDDKDRSKGLYLLRVGSAKKSHIRYRLQIQTRDTQCNVTLHLDDGKSDKKSIALLSELHAAMQ